MRKNRIAALVLRRLLHQDVEHVPVLVERTPEIVAQVKVFGRRSTLDPACTVLSDTIHPAVVQALTCPPEKRFHRPFGLDDGDFFYPSDQSDRYVINEISLFEGRSPAARKALIRALYQHIPGATGIMPQDIEVTLFETPRNAWGIRGLPGDEIGLNYKAEV